MRWSGCCRTDVGSERTINEDSYTERPESGLWAVADGMGGHEAGDYASKTVSEALATGFVPERLAESVEAVESIIEDVNLRIWREAQRRRQTIGTTVAVLLTRDQHCVACWVGDSRIYLYRDARLTPVTVDHTEYEALRAAPAAGAGSPDEQQGTDVLTRAVGVRERVYVDYEYVQARPGDIFLLCSDGLNKELDDAEIESLLGQASGIEAAADALMAAALARLGRDNITLALARSSA